MHPVKSDRLIDSTYVTQLSASREIGLLIPPILFVFLIQTVHNLAQALRESISTQPQVVHFTIILVRY